VYVPLTVDSVQSAAPSSWPLVVLAVNVVLVVCGIALLRLHAFIVLMLAAISVGLMSATLPGAPPANVWVQAVELPMREFGAAAGNIGFIIVLASIIGQCMLDSGAADSIVRRFMTVFGERRAALALLGSGFLLSIPVFFDTVFFLLVPLARALGLRTGKNYMLYVMAMCGGGVLTHSLVAPTPGPLLVADALRPAGVDLGVSMVAGLAAGVLPAVGVIYLAGWLNRRVPVPVREAPGLSLSELQATVDRPSAALPGFGVSLLPVMLPVLLIAGASFLSMAQASLPGVVAALGGPEAFARIKGTTDFAGNRNVAMLVGTVIALVLLARQKRMSLRDLGAVMGPPLELAGVIILITAAGGAFGAMIRHSGVGAVIGAMSAGRSIDFVLLAWTVTAVIRLAQGSATVAMITGAGLMAAIVGDGNALPFHPVYLFLAIGFGSMIGSWMNDSGFWVVGRLSGFTERETLKSWTVMTTFLSLAGLVQILIVSRLLPLR
jgi:GntP family gluconate:H+ symporter